MGASSVTGTGDGAATQTKGPGNGREIYKPFVNPQVVIGGRSVTSVITFEKDIYFAPLDGGYNGTYIAHITAESVNFRVGIASLHTDADSNLIGFTVESVDARTDAAASAWFIWSVVQKGTN